MCIMHKIAFAIQNNKKNRHHDYPQIIKLSVSLTFKESMELLLLMFRFIEQIENQLKMWNLIQIKLHISLIFSNLIININGPNK